MNTCKYCGKLLTLTPEYDTCMECQGRIMRETIYGNNGGTSTNSTKPYSTAHEKLLTLGFTYSKEGNKHQYEKTLSGGRKDYTHNFMVIIVDEKEKLFKGYKSINDYFTGHFSTYELSFDLELARIMVQYLEEMR